MKARRPSAVARDDNQRIAAEKTDLPCPTTTRCSWRRR